MAWSTFSGFDKVSALDVHVYMFVSRKKIMSFIFQFFLENKNISGLQLLRGVICSKNKMFTQTPVLVIIIVSWWQLSIILTEPYAASHPLSVDDVGLTYSWSSESRTLGQPFFPLYCMYVVLFSEVENEAYLFEDMESVEFVLFWEGLVNSYHLPCLNSYHYSLLSYLKVNWFLSTYPSISLPPFLSLDLSFSLSLTLSLSLSLTHSLSFSPSLSPS